MLSIFKSLFKKRLANSAPARNQRTRLSVELLEDRLVPAFLTVTNTLDNGSAGTLRACVTQANLDGAQGMADSISFGANLTGAHLLLQQGHLELTSGTNVAIWGSGIALNGDGDNLFQVDNGATLDLHEVTLAGGTVNGNGGAINNAGTLALYLCTITDNSATGAGSMGGGIYNTGTLLTSYPSTFTNNSASLGGAVANSLGGSASLANATFSGNSATVSGGALYNNGAMTVAGSTLSGNAAPSNGGGLFNDASGTATVATCTLADNSSGAGGAMTNWGALTVSAATVSGNSAWYGGGIVNYRTLTLADTIVAGNTLSSSSGTNPDIAGSVTADSAFNIIGDGTGLFGISNGQSGNQIGASSSPIDPLLAPLGNNGGPTQTMPPQAGSPALHAGGYVTTLTAAIGAQDTVIQVADAAAIASTALETGIQIDGEQLWVTSVDLSANTLTVGRSPFGGTASHSAGAGVYFQYDQKGSSLTATLAIGAAQPVAVTDPAVAFTVSVPTVVSEMAGYAFSVTITAVDANGNTATQYSGPVTLTCSDGQMAPLNVILQNGVATATVNLDKAESADTLTASDGTISGTSAPFTVISDGIADLTVSVPSYVTAGVSFNAIVTGTDPFGNPANGIAILQTGGAGVYWDVDLSNGQGVVPLTLDFAETIQFTACVGLGSALLATSNDMTVAPGTATAFAVTTATNSAMAGTAISVTITAEDAFGNTATGYNGTVTLSSSDGQPVAPYSVTLSQGTATVSALLDKADTLALQVSDGSITSSSNTITVMPRQLIVTSSLDPAGTVVGTLRYAVNQANTDAQNGISDAITFDTTQMNTSTITLEQGDLELRAGSGTVTINGGQQISIGADLNSGVFGVDSGANVVLTGLTIDNGQALAGGGISNAGTLTVTNATIANNGASSANGNGNGGGIYNTGSLTLTDVTVANNLSGGFLGSFGAGLYNAGIATLTDVTAANNTAQEGPLQFGGTQYGSGGGGIYNDGTLTLTATTVSGNNATTGGGICNTGLLTLTDTIVAGNTAGMDPDIQNQGTVAASSAYNLIGNSNALANGINHNQDGTPRAPINALLAPLGNYGGPTQTMALLPGSPAIGTGEAITGITTDQRGQPVASPPAIGSYQTGKVTLVVTVTGTVTADTPFTVTVTAVDASGQPVLADSFPVALTATAGNIVLPASITLTNGSWTGLVTLHTPGRITLTASAGSVNGSTTFTVNPAAVASFTFTAPAASSYETAGVSFSVTVNALDGAAQADLGYNGTFTLSVTGNTQKVLGLSSTTLSMVNGTWTGKITLDTAGTVTLTAAAVTGSVKGTSGNIIVQAAQATHLAATAPSPVVAGNSFQLTIKATDAFNNPANLAVTTPTITCSPTQTVAIGSGTVEPGILVEAITLDKAGSFTLTVSLGTLRATCPITVNPAAAAKFVVSAAAGTQTTGAAFNVTITPQDQWGNVTTYTGGVTVTSSDRQTVASGGHVNFSGQNALTDSVTLNFVSTVTLTAKADASASLFGTSNSIAINAVAEQGSIWAGYALQYSGITATAIGGTWVQPAVSGTGNANSSTWVGIDGDGGSTVEQCGTEAKLVNGKPQYVAWYEFFGDQAANGNKGPDYNQVNIPTSQFAVHPGDTITAEVLLVAGTSREFAFIMIDQQKGGGVEQYATLQTMQYVTPQLASAEWIVENPNNGTQPLANFGQVSFSNAWATYGANTGSINSFADPQALSIVSSAGNAFVSNPPVNSNNSFLGQPSNVTSTSSFTVGYGTAPASGTGNGTAKAVKSARTANAAAPEVVPARSSMADNLLMPLAQAPLNLPQGPPAPLAADSMAVNRLTAADALFAPHSALEHRWTWHEHGQLANDPIVAMFAQDEPPFGFAPTAKR